MHRAFATSVAVLLLSSAAHSQSTSLAPAQLDVNLGPIRIDAYDGTRKNEADLDKVPAANPTNPLDRGVWDTTNCALGAVYRTCIQNILASYSSQGLTGVTIQLGLNGGPAAGSTDWSGTTLGPFTDTPGDGPKADGGISEPWLVNLGLFFQDVRAADIPFVSLRISLDNSMGALPDNMVRRGCVDPTSPDIRFATDPSCLQTVNSLVCPAQGGPQTDGPVFVGLFYPYLPYAIDPCDNSPLRSSLGNSAYNYAPYLTRAQGAWGWGTDSRIYRLFRAIGNQAALAGITIRAVSIFDELALSQDTVRARLLWDTTSQDANGNSDWMSPFVMLSGAIQAGASGETTPVFVSTLANEPIYSQTCSSWYGDSAVVFDLSELLAALTGSQFGQPVSRGTNPVPGLHCYQDANNGDMFDPSFPGMTLPVGLFPSLTFVDIHNYPTDQVIDPFYSWINNPDLNSTFPLTFPDLAPIKDVYGNPYVASQDYDGNAAASSTNAATTIYNAIYSTLTRWKSMTNWQSLPANLKVIIGETNPYSTYQSEGAVCPYSPSDFPGVVSVQNPFDKSTHNVNTSCRPDNRWHRPWSNLGASENETGFLSSTLYTQNGTNTILRPFNPIGWGQMDAPAHLGPPTDGPYNAGACTYSLQPNYDNIGVSSGGGLYSVFTVQGTARSNCLWNIAPTPPARSTDSSNAAGWLTVAPGPTQWQQGTQNILFTFQPNNDAPRLTSLTIAGRPVTISQLSPAGSFWPANGATGVSLTPTLGWGFVSSAQRYDVYFGVAPNPPKVASTGTRQINYQPGTLNPGTTYYWQIMVVLTTGQQFQWVSYSFTTTGAGITGYLYDWNGNQLPGGAVTLTVDGQSHPTQSNPYSISISSGQHTVSTSIPSGYTLAGYKLQGGGKVNSSSVTFSEGTSGTSLNWYYLPASVSLSNVTLSSSATYYASSSITAGTAVTVPGGARVSFQSGGQITLTPGFHAGGAGGAGTAFHAYIAQNW